jgi:pyrimidine-specific ribonucleoside hydrolase
MRWMMDRMMFLSVPAPARDTSGRSAVELLRTTIEGAPEPVTLIAVGGLTNAAELLQSDPAIAKQLEAIYIMGGAVDVPGNIQEIVPRSPNAVAEWNIYTDPYAASVVFRSGVPIALVPLDATDQIPVTDAFRQRLRADQTSEAARYAYRVLYRLHSLASSRPFYLWDPMTVAVGLDDSLGTFEERALSVVTDEGPCCGQTRQDPDGVEVRVCKRIQPQRFEAVFIDALNGRVG